MHQELPGTVENESLRTSESGNNRAGNPGIVLFYTNSGCSIRSNWTFSSTGLAGLYFVTPAPYICRCNYLRNSETE